MRKQLNSLQVKDAGEGTVTAVFATLNAIDHDGDVTRPGAFGEQEVQLSAYNHKSWEGALPVGKGRIYEQGDTAIMEGKFFMDTTGGRETFTVVKEMGDLMEYSYGFDILEASEGKQDDRPVRFLESLKVFEVSPVLRGAGVGTRTLEAKSLGLKLNDHAAHVLADVDGLIKRSAEVMAMRAQKGKELGPETVVALTALQQKADEIGALLAGASPHDDDAAQLRDELAREAARFQRTFAAV